MQIAPVSLLPSGKRFVIPLLGGDKGVGLFTKEMETYTTIHSGCWCHTERPPVFYDIVGQEVEVWHIGKEPPMRIW